MSEERQNNQMALVPIEEPVSQPRQPRNLQDLLRYSVEVADSTTAEEKEAVESELAKKEKQEFLFAAMKSMTVNEVEVVLKALDTLREVNERVSKDTDITHYVEQLELIADSVHAIDIANDFCKYGGISVMHNLLRLPQESLQIGAAGIIGDCAQNNPNCQKIAIKEENLLADLVNLLDKSSSADVRIKTLYAVSCIIRDNSEGVEAFKKLDGFDVINRAIQSDIDKLVVKCAYLIMALCSQDSKIKDVLVEKHYIENVMSLIHSPDVCPVLESLIRVLARIVADHDGAEKVLKATRFNEEEIFLEVIEKCRDDEAYTELVESAAYLVNLIREDPYEDPWEIDFENWNG